MFDVSTRGAGDLRRVSRKLRETGNKELRRELSRGITRSVKPLTLAVRASTDVYLPDNYAAVLSRSLKVRTRRRTSARTPGIKLIATAKTARGKERRLRDLEQGRLRHPVFGNRSEWVQQSVRREWWSEPLTAGAPEVRREIVDVLDDIERKLGRA